jgi:hypothetical protein
MSVPDKTCNDNLQSYHLVKLFTSTSEYHNSTLVPPQVSETVTTPLYILLTHLQVQLCRLWLAGFVKGLSLRIGAGEVMLWPRKANGEVMLVPRKAVILKR